MTNNMLHLAQ